MVIHPGARMSDYVEGHSGAERDILIGETSN